MTAGVRHDLSTKRAQAVVPGQVRRPVAHCHYRGRAVPRGLRMGHNMMHNANVDD